MGIWKPMTIAVALLGITMIHSDEYDDLQWAAYKEKYNKTYDTPEEEQEAKGNFEKNVHEHFMHNLNDTNNYTLGVHEYSDQPVDEVEEILCGTDPPEGVENVSRRNYISSRAWCSSKDWVAQNVVSDVKHQHQCGSCWAFAATQALEGQAAMRWGRVYTISEQQLMDCSSSYGNNGCQGGWPSSAYRYMRDEGGEVMEYCYPYTAKVSSCSVNQSCYHFKVQSYVEVGPSGNEDAVANALCEKGPLSIAICADHNMFSYKSGIYHSDSCDCQINHAMLLVGFGTDNGLDYWKAKNSWGPRWGENGYIRIARNQNNMCKVATYAAYPVLA